MKTILYLTVLATLSLGTALAGDLKEVYPAMHGGDHHDKGGGWKGGDHDPFPYQTPEPSTFVQLGLGLATVGLLLRFKR